MIGITSYGAYVPPTRLPFSVIGGRPPKEGGPEKAVAWNDEDSVTMGVSAAIHCLRGIDRERVDGLLFASTTYAFKEKQAAALIARALDLRRDVRTADYSGSLRAGITALRGAVDSVDRTRDVIPNSVQLPPNVGRCVDEKHPLRLWKHQGQAGHCPRVGRIAARRTAMDATARGVGQSAILCGAQDEDIRSQSAGLDRIGSGLHRAAIATSEVKTESHAADGERAGPHPGQYRRTGLADRNE